MPAYYNEIDPFAAQWLRNLMAAGHIPAGDVDERSIEDVRPDDLRGYEQCHFFAGIGGWAYALALAGWPPGRPVWTGSCPCQPFSQAGKGAGFDDQRHLWPAWFHLIRECRPAILFGEQVSSKDADPWVDLVHAGLEGVGYAFGCIPFPAAGVGAPHIRDRNYWMAHASGPRFSERVSNGRVQSEALGACAREAAVRRGTAGWVGYSELSPQERQRQYGGALVPQQEAAGPGLPSPTYGSWRHIHWLPCADGKYRPVEPGTQPLAHGIPGRVGRLRAYGNAIVPEAAAQFVASYLEIEQQLKAAA